MTPIDRAKADIAKMRSEIGQIENRLEGLRSRLQKAEAYVEMSALYESEASFQENTRVRTGIAAIAVNHAKELITEKWESIHTRDILKSLENIGVQVGGNNPVANLSGFLSRSEDLKNDRAKGWGLSEWGDSSKWPKGKNKTLNAIGLIPPLEESSTMSNDTGNSELETSNSSCNANIDDDIPF